MIYQGSHYVNGTVAGRTWYARTSAFHMWTAFLNCTEHIYRKGCTTYSVLSCNTSSANVRLRKKWFHMSNRISLINKQKLMRIQKNIYLMCGISPNGLPLSTCRIYYLCKLQPDEWLLYIVASVGVNITQSSQMNVTTAYFWRWREITNRRRHVAARAVEGI